MRLNARKEGTVWLLSRLMLGVVGRGDHGPLQALSTAQVLQESCALQASSRSIEPVSSSSAERSILHKQVQMGPDTYQVRVRRQLRHYLELSTNLCKDIT